MESHQLSRQGAWAAAGTPSQGSAKLQPQAPRPQVPRQWGRSASSVGSGMNLGCPTGAGASQEDSLCSPPLAVLASGATGASTRPPCALVTPNAPVTPVSWCPPMPWCPPHAPISLCALVPPLCPGVPQCPGVPRDPVSPCSRGDAPYGWGPGAGPSPPDLGVGGSRIPDGGRKRRKRRRRRARIFLQITLKGKDEGLARRAGWRLLRQPAQLLLLPLQGQEPNQAPVLPPWDTARTGAPRGQRHPGDRDTPGQGFPGDRDTPGQGQPRAVGLEQRHVASPAPAAGALPGGSW